MNRLSILLAFAIFQCSFLFTSADINLGISDFKCPTNYNIYPHPERCELYYTCYNTEPTYLWQCRSNLLFDLVYDGCNWPEQTYCGNRTRPGAGPELTTNIQAISTETTSSPSLSSAKPTTCPDDGFYPAYTDRCSSNFYTCLDGYPFSTYCPSYGVFEPINRRCVSPNSSACKIAPSTTSAPASPTSNITTSVVYTSMAPVPTTARTAVPTAMSTAFPTTIVVSKTTVAGAFVCPGNGTYADPSQCSTYYVCDNGTAYIFACPTGLVFNPAGGVCDWPSSVPSCTGK